MSAVSIPELVNRDAFFVPPDRPGARQRIALRFINDGRDLPFVDLSLQMTFLLIPAAAALFAMRSFPWWAAVLYLAFLYLVFVDRFILMLHNTSHRSLFKQKYRFMNLYIPWVLGPFCGETPETYFAHHVGMHHPENNLREDLSSTMKYQRDSFIHFMRYFFRFFFLVQIEMTFYLLRKNRRGLLRKMLFGELSAFALWAVLAYFWSWQATLVVFVIPFVATRFLMMCGNWGQHAFVDRAAPENCYRNSITCVDSRYNRRCFNDGYHIAHHLKATMHWTELPGELEKNAPLYAKERALVFSNTDFFVVWLLLMLKQHHRIARTYIHLGEGPQPSTDEIVSVMKERLAPIPAAG